MAMKTMRVGQKMRDRQRSKVYDFDDWLLEHVQAGSLTLDECHFVVGLCLAHMKMNPEIMPTIKDGRRNKCASGGANVLVLPRWSRNTVIVPHEMAHCIVQRLIGVYTEPHGAEFVRIYCHLIAKIHRVDEAVLVKEAKSRGIRVASASWLRDLRKRAPASILW